MDKVKAITEVCLICGKRGFRDNMKHVGTEVGDVKTTFMNTVTTHNWLWAHNFCLVTVDCEEWIKEQEDSNDTNS